MTELTTGSKIYGYKLSNLDKINRYVVFAKCPNAVSNPNNAYLVNIRHTKNIKDTSQKNFELLVQGIGLRMMPVLIEEPIAVEDLKAEGAPSLEGEGFKLVFGVDKDNAFTKLDNPVGLLIEELNGIVLNNGVILKTTGDSVNIEFVKEQNEELKA